MKYQRLRIANYRGVDSSVIEFDSAGMTLIQGPNEAGKTSLGEAIGILFEHPDSASNKYVKAIRPVHQDAGPEIELKAESGPYKFNYFKRFSKKPETKLTVSAPAPENHTGREAHDRALEILEETLDIALWKALTIRQGDAIAQPNLAEEQSLSAALDKAAGGVPTDPAEEGLFEKVAEEYGRFYSIKTGKENKDLKDKTAKQDQAEAEVSDLEKRIDDLDKDIETVTRLQGEISELQERESKTRKTLSEQSKLLHEIHALEVHVSESGLKLESVIKTREIASRDKVDRKKRIDVVAQLEKELQELRRSTAESLSGLKQSELQLISAEQLFQDANKQRQHAEALATIRRADFDYYNDRLSLEQLSERKDRIDTARKSAAQAEAFLDASKVNQQALDAIESAERELLMANAKRESAAPIVKIRGLKPCEIEIDGDPTSIEKDENRELPVADRRRLTIPDRIEIEMEPGANTDDLGRHVEQLQRTLETACSLAGVESPDSARAAFQKRVEATRSIDEKERIEHENLRDLSYGELADKLLRLQETVPRYVDNRSKETAIAADLSAARIAWEAAETAHRESQTKYDSAQQSLSAARGILDRLSKANESERVQLRSLEKTLEQENSQLKVARESYSDSLLDKAAREAEQTVAVQQQALKNAQSELTAKSPEKVKALVETAESTLDSIKTQYAKTQTKLTEVQTRLKIHGEEGLHEKLQAARTRLEVITSANRSLYRQAGAAKLLFEIMGQERDKARQAYVKPLKEKVERLGRLVFDESFQVDLDDNLRIVARTIGGIRVPFDSLSGGTKEQLSLIFRLACSIIVAEEGGMPLIMDDALGYTDPGRLQLMGAVLAKAAKECQIVIFTCVPERYGNVGSVAIVSL